MSKYILGTHEGKPFTPSVVSFLQKKALKVIQTKSWSEAITVCRNVRFDLIVGCCNIDIRDIDRILAKINNNYIENAKSAASIILQAHRRTPDFKQFLAIKEHLKAIMPSSINESNIISIIHDALSTRS